MSHAARTFSEMRVSRRSALAGMIAATLGATDPKLNLTAELALSQNRRLLNAIPLSPAASNENNSLQDWPMAQADFMGTRAAAGSAISSKTIERLEVAWTLPLDAVSGYGAITSNPVVVGDVVFIVDQLGNVHAIKKDTGDVIWRKDYNVSTIGPNGVAIGDGAVVSVLGDTAEVVQLDIKTGSERWRRQLANQPGLGITTTPLIYRDSIIVGTAPGGKTNAT